MIKVKAKATGVYHGGVRKAGDVFTLLPTSGQKKGLGGKMVEVILSPEEQFNPRWMEKIEEPKKA